MICQCPFIHVVARPHEDLVVEHPMLHLVSSEICFIRFWVRKHVKVQDDEVIM